MSLSALTKQRTSGTHYLEVAVRHGEALGPSFFVETCREVQSDGPDTWPLCPWFTACLALSGSLEGGSLTLTVTVLYSQCLQ